jgi:polysaccharide pyruvyl transferase WcaK-like protein
MFPNSVGPFRTQLGKWFAQISLNMCGYLLIRDSKSYEIVNDLKIKSPRRLTWDTALLFQTEKKITLEETSHPLVGVSPGIYRSSLSKKQVQDYIHAHSKALDYLIKRYGVKVLFLPHYVTGLSYDDLEISKLIMKEMKQAKSASVMAFENVDEFKSTVDQLEMIFSSKMHPAVLAISGHVPVLCVAYDHKQTSFFNSLGLNEYVIPIRMISAEALISRFDQLWKRKTEIQNLLEKKIPVLRENVRNAIKCALQILQ